MPDCMHGKRLLIFDFDGTIVETTPLHARAFAEVLEPLGIPVDYATIAGLRTSAAIEICIRSSGRMVSQFDLPALVADKQRRVRRLIASELKSIPQVEAFLHWARGRFRLALVTSGSRVTVEHALKKVGYEELFDPTVYAEDVSCAKPAPDGFHRALRLAGFGADEALVFEDSAAGFQAASAAGLSYIDARTFDWSFFRH